MLAPGLGFILTHFCPRPISSAPWVPGHVCLMDPCRSESALSVLSLSARLFVFATPGFSLLVPYIRVYVSSGFWRVFFLYCVMSAFASFNKTALNRNSIQSVRGI